MGHKKREMDDLLKKLSDICHDLNDGLDDQKVHLDFRK